MLLALCFQVVVPTPPPSPKVVRIEPPTRASSRLDAGPPVAIDAVPQLWQFERRSDEADVFFRDTDSAFGRILVNVGDVTQNGTDDLCVGAVVQQNKLPEGELVEFVEGRDGSAVIRSGRPLVRVYGTVLSATRVADLTGDGSRDVLFATRIPWDGDFAPQDVRVRPVPCDFEFKLQSPIAEWNGFGEIAGIADLGDLDGDGNRELGFADSKAQCVSIFETCRSKPRRELRLAKDHNHSFGASIASGFDLDGDGKFELAVGATQFSSDAEAENTRASTSCGAVFVFDGASLEPRLRVESTQPGAYFGRRVQTCGDLNGDGKAELAISAPWEHNGRVYVVSAIDGTRLHVFEGDTEHTTFGLALDVESDFDADGVRDVVIGAPCSNHAEGTSSGLVELYSGRSGRRLLRIDGPALADRTQWGERNEEYRGRPSNYDWPRGDSFGWSVATGDFDGDGLADLAIGSPQRGADHCVGKVYALSGVELRKRFSAGK